MYKLNRFNTMKNIPNYQEKLKINRTITESYHVCGTEASDNLVNIIKLITASD